MEKPVMTRLLILLISLSCIFAAQAVFAGPKNGKIQVHAECVFRSTTVTDCPAFKDAFFQLVSSLVERSEVSTGSDLEFSVTDSQIDPNHIGYIFIWRSHMSKTEESTFAVPLELPTAFDALTTLSKLSLNAVKGLNVFLNIENETTGENGQLIATFSSPLDKGDNPKKSKPSWTERLAKSPWYFSGNMYLNGGNSGSGSASTSNTSLSNSSEAGYFKDKFKIYLTGSYYKTSQSLPDGSGGHITGHDTVKVYTGLAVYSLSKNWSVAVANTSVTDPGSNVQFANVLDSGVEWTLVPFRTTENRELAIRVGPEYGTGTLLQPNVYDHLTEAYLGAFVQVYFYWVTHQDKLIFSGSVTDTQNFNLKADNRILVNGSIKYEVNRVLGFRVGANYTYKPVSLTYPGNPDYSNPLRTMFLSGQPGRSLSYNASISFTFGNSKKKSSDRRWTTN